MEAFRRQSTAKLTIATIRPNSSHIKGLVTHSKEPRSMITMMKMLFICKNVFNFQWHSLVRAGQVWRSSWNNQTVVHSWRRLVRPAQCSCWCDGYSPTRPLATIPCCGGCPICFLYFLFEHHLSHLVLFRL